MLVPFGGNEEIQDGSGTFDARAKK
jgi:hypothetical protein